MLAVSIPNSDTLAALVETATKCFDTALTSPPRPLSDQSRAVRALVIVSKVVKVFEETTKSVSSGLRSWTVANLSRIHNRFAQRRGKRKTSSSEGAADGTTPG